MKILVRCSSGLIQLLFCLQDEKKKDPHLARGGGQGARHHGSVGHLDRQVLVVDERPGPLHLTRLEVIPERPQVGVPEEAAVGVVGRRRVAAEAALVVAHLRPVRALLAVGLLLLRRRRRQQRRGGRGVGAGLGRGPLPGAVVLAHQILDAMLGRVERQVPPAGPGGAAHAAVVRPQRRAELLLGAGARGGGPELGVTPEYLALQARCRWGGGANAG